MNITVQQMNKIMAYAYRFGQLKGTVRLYKLGVLTSIEALAQIDNELSRPIEVTEVKEVEVKG